MRLKKQISIKTRKLPYGHVLTASYARQLNNINQNKERGNKINILSAIGNIGKDAEVRFTQKNEPVATFSFALQSGYGEKQITTWLNCQIWGKRAETLAPMLIKGTRIGITGELTNRPYVSKSGEERHSLELRVSDVTLLGAKENAPKRQESQDKGGFDEMEDDIPFN